MLLYLGKRYDVLFIIVDVKWLVQSFIQNICIISLKIYSLNT